MIQAGQRPETRGDRRKTYARAGYIALLFAGVTVCLWFDWSARPETRAVRVEQQALCFYPQDASRTGEAYGVLTVETLRGDAKRRGYFTVDTGIPQAWRVNSGDYEKSGFDIGHLAAAAWYGDQNAQNSTFTFSNACPVNPKLNRGLWAAIERQIKNEVGIDTVVYFAVTPLWLPGSDGKVCFQTIGKHRVWVPTHLAASILVEHQGQAIAARAWIVPNAEPPAGATTGDYRATVDEHEFARGRDFFDWLDDDIENRLEAAK